MRYLGRMFRDLDKDFIRPLKKNLPLIEAVAAMIILSRGMAESMEIFPYSVSKILMRAAYSWAYAVASVIDRIYGALGYPLSPRVVLTHKLPAENPVFPMPVWMMALWSFSIVYTFMYWLAMTGATYGIGRALGGKGGSFLRLLTWTGIAHIPMINWWFDVGCEMMYEVVQQKVYMSLFPPYANSAEPIRIPTPWGPLPSFVPVETFWSGYGMGAAFMIVTTLLLYGLTKREMKLSVGKAAVAVLPWIVYFVLLFVGSLNIPEITRALDEYLRRGMTWRCMNG